MFTYKETDESGIQYYQSKDAEFEVLKQKDADFFLLYRLNPKDNMYDWTESKNTSLEDCEKEAKQLLGL